MSAQPGILADVPPASRYLTFRLRPSASPRAAIERLGELPVTPSRVVGLGPSTLATLSARIDGIRAHPRYSVAGAEVPSTPSALWVWLRGEDRGELMHAGRELVSSLDDAFALEDAVDGFRYREGRDLTGYVDGTENPTAEDAVAAALVAGRGPGLDGASFVAVQRWEHALATFDALDEAERDAIIGRRIADNEEIEDAPPSAHVKRTAQEDFEPPAFLLRRSMPWSVGDACGLMFVAFGRSFDAYEAQLQRMVGADDGVADAVFRISSPRTGAFFWCPPVHDGRLNLRALGAAAAGPAGGRE
jgi:putative iron-dependent peroxidase